MNSRIVLITVFTLLVGCAGTPPERPDPIAEAEQLYQAQRYAEALPVYREQARAGNKIAQNRLALMYEHGLGVEADLAEAYAWASLAAELGRFRLVQHWADINARLEPQTQDEAEERALHLLRNYGIMTQNDALRERTDNNFSRIGFARHHFERQNYTRALDLYRELAQAGEKYSQYRLAYMFRNGLGAQENPPRAYAWAAIASELGNPIFVDFYADLAESLGAEEIESGEEILEELLDRSSVLALAYKRARNIEFSKSRCREERQFLSRCARFAEFVCADKDECLDNFGGVNVDARLVERSQQAQQRLTDFITRYEQTYGNVILREFRLIDDPEESDESEETTEETEEEDPESSRRHNERD